MRMNDFEKQMIGRLLYENLEFVLKWQENDYDGAYVTAIHSSASVKKWWRLIIYSKGDYLLCFQKRRINGASFNADSIIHAIKEEIM